MITKELMSYIQKEFHSGVSSEHVKRSLEEKGWNPRDIDEAISRVEGGEIEPPEGNGIIHLLKKSWSIYTRRLSTYLGVVSVSFFFSLTVIFLGVGTLGAPLTPIFEEHPELRTMLQSENQEEVMDGLATLFPLLPDWWFVLLGISVFFLWSIEIVLEGAIYLSRKEGREESGVKALYKESVSFFPRALLIGLFYLVLGCLLWLVFFFLPTMLIEQTTLISDQSVPLFAALSVFLFFLVAALLIPYIAFAFPSCFLDGLSPKAAILESIRLVRGRWNFVAWRVFTPAILLIFLVILIDEILPGAFSLLWVFVLSPMVMLYFSELYSELKKHSTPTSVTSS